MPEASRAPRKAIWKLIESHEPEAPAAPPAPVPPVAPDPLPDPSLMPEADARVLAELKAAATPVMPTLARAPELARAEPPKPTPPPSVAAALGNVAIPRARAALDTNVFDHPSLGGKFTVCVLCYGPYYNLARQCLSSILSTIPPERLDLRVAGNECCQETINYVNSLPVTKTYFEPGPRRKYPAMRAMFHDQECPITTPYTIWFDDDTWAVNAHWLRNLAQTIIANEPYGVALYGKRVFNSLRCTADRDERNWFKKANWFQGRMFQDKSGNETPNGDKIWFVAGWWWAIQTAYIYHADIPDIRIGHNGDPCIGFQVHQAGGKIKDLNHNKELIACPPKEKGGRRGFSEPYPWALPNADLTL